MPEAPLVRSMFARIAPRYDLLNHLLSMGIDRSWRRRLLRRAGPLAGKLAVDACSGTGDLALVLGRAGARVVGVDFTLEMLLRAAAKKVDPRGSPVGFCHGDALCLPVPDGSVDLATVAFGIRNVADRGRGLEELRRVVRPGGDVFVLEFSMPRNALLRRLYLFYFRSLLPRIGGWISGDASAYTYLPDTVLAWPSPEEFRAEMERAGLEQCGFERLSGGIACLSYGRVPRLPGSPEDE